MSEQCSESEWVVPKRVLTHTHTHTHSLTHFIGFQTLRWVSESEHAHALMAPRLPAPTEGPDACKVWEIRVIKSQSKTMEEVLACWVYFGCRIVYQLESAHDEVITLRTAAQRDTHHTMSRSRLETARRRCCFIYNALVFRLLLFLSWRTIREAPPPAAAAAAPP